MTGIVFVLYWYSTVGGARQEEKRWHAKKTMEEKMAATIGLRMVACSQPCQVSRWMAEALLPHLAVSVSVAGAPNHERHFAHCSPESSRQTNSAANIDANTTTNNTTVAKSNLTTKHFRSCRPQTRRLASYILVQPSLARVSISP
jgi:hypothetical protein